MASREIPDGVGPAERGQASVELVAVIPALLLALLIAIQLAVAGYALWSAALAARAGARAAAVGRAAAPAARGALPTVLRRTARVRGRETVEVRVHVPRVLPAVPRFAVSARTRLGPVDSRG